MKRNQQLKALYRHANLYTSGPYGQQFNVALKDVRYSPYQGREYVDVQKVASIEGTYIANYVQKGEPKTIISYNKGAQWYSLSMDGNKNGDEAQGLHLALDSAKVLYGMPTPKSTDTASGVVLANGWIGTGVPRFQPAATASTFLSRDGGYTWKQLGTAVSDFQILDHGGVLVMVPWRTKTDTLQFSIDEGRTVSNYTFLNKQSSLNFAGEFKDKCQEQVGEQGRN